MKATKKLIQTFLDSKKIAVAGVSRNEKKFGQAAFRELEKRGYDVYPVNPNAEDILGKKCYTSVSELPSEINSLLVITPKTQTLGVLKDAVSRGIKNIWIQQISENPETIEYIKANNLNPVIKQCILMHAEPVKGFHKFHRMIYRIFGVLPK